jgi:hypothetical protein
LLTAFGSVALLVHVYPGRLSLPFRTFPDEILFQERNWQWLPVTVLLVLGTGIILFELTRKRRSLMYLVFILWPMAYLSSGQTVFGIPLHEQKAPQSEKKYSLWKTYHSFIKSPSFCLPPESGRNAFTFYCQIHEMTRGEKNWSGHLAAVPTEALSKKLLWIGVSFPSEPPSRDFHLDLYRSGNKIKSIEPFQKDHGSIVVFAVGEKLEAGDWIEILGAPPNFNTLLWAHE